MRLAVFLQSTVDAILFRLFFQLTTPVVGPIEECHYPSSLCHMPLHKWVCTNFSNDCIEAVEKAREGLDSLFHWNTLTKGGKDLTRTQ